MTKAKRNQKFEKHIRAIAEDLKDEGATFVFAVKTQDGGALTYSNGENSNLLAITAILIDHLSDWIHKSPKTMEKAIEYYRSIKKEQGND